MPVVRTIRAHVDEVVEIVWYRSGASIHQSIADADPLRERHSAPPKATWDARERARLDAAEAELDMRQNYDDHHGD